MKHNMKTFGTVAALALTASLSNAAITNLTANGDWNVGPWSSGVPGIGDDAVINAGVAGTANDPVAGWSGSLTLNSGSSLTIDPNDGMGAITGATSITLNNANIINAFQNGVTVAAITLNGGGGWIQSGSNATHDDDIIFGNAITGTGGFTVEGNNKNKMFYNAANTFTGGLTLTALDRYVNIFNVAGSAGAGDVTQVKRTDGRSGSIDLRADNVFASSANLSLEGTGAFGLDGFAAGQLIDVNTFSNTVASLTVDGVVIGAGTYEAGDFAWIIGGTGGTLTVLPIPEPSSTALLGLGGLALILRRRR